MKSLIINFKLPGFIKHLVYIKLSFHSKILMGNPLLEKKKKNSQD